MGLKPSNPVNDAGMRIDPPPSAASATLASPAATETAAPPLEPPSVRVVSHGLLASGPRRLSLVADWPNSAVLVLPVNTAPEALSRPTTPLSCCVRLRRCTTEPKVVTAPASGNVSLIEIGTPLSGNARPAR